MHRRIRRDGGTTKNFLEWFNRQQEVDVTQLLTWVDDINQGWIISTSKNKIMYINKQAKKLLSIKKDSNIGAIRPNAAGAINKLLNNFIVSSHRIKVKLDMRSKMKFIGCTFRSD